MLRMLAAAASGGASVWWRPALFNPLGSCSLGRPAAVSHAGSSSSSRSRALARLAAVSQAGSSSSSSSAPAPEPGRRRRRLPEQTNSSSCCSSSSRQTTSSNTDSNTDSNPSSSSPSSSSFSPSSTASSSSSSSSPPAARPCSTRQHGTRPLRPKPRSHMHASVQPRPPAFAARAPPARPAAAAVRRGNVSLRASVSRVVHENEESGFKIIKAKVLKCETDPSAGTALLAAAAAAASKQQLHLLGPLPGVQPGHELSVRGSWEENPTYGWQVKVLEFQPEAASDPVELLVSCVKGVGQVTAKLIVASLGAANVKKVLDGPTEEAVAALAAIKGIGKIRAASIKADYDEHHDIQNAFTWLRSLGSHVMPVGRAWAIAAQLGSSTQQVVTDNPYFPMRLGCSLREAELIAQATGCNPDSPHRAAAVLMCELKAAAANESATGLPWQLLESRGLQALQKLNILPLPTNRRLLAGARQLQQNSRIVVEEVQWGQQQWGQQVVPSLQLVSPGSSWSDAAHVSLAALYVAECRIVDFFLQAAAQCHQTISSHLASLENDRSKDDDDSSSSSSSSGNSSSGNSRMLAVLAAIAEKPADWLEECQQELSAELEGVIKLNEGQRAAVILARMLPLLVLTGGPGCGKTLTSQAVARAWMNEYAQRLAMAAPTGRASQRLAELMAGCPGEVSSSTIHRLLAYTGFSPAAPSRPAADAFPADADGDAVLGSDADPDADVDPMARRCRRDEMNPLEVGCLLLDEVSMMDVTLAAAVFRASRRVHSMLLVGDADQLPPVGPGRPLAAALEARVLPVIDLRHIYRSAAGSAIVRAAHAINSGAEPEFTTWQLRPGSVAADLAAHITNASPENALDLPSNALLLELPDGCLAAEVQTGLSEAVQQLLPELRGLDATKDVQVLSPTRKGPLGVVALNSLLQERLNPESHDKPELRVDGQKFRLGDRVVHLVNDTNLDVWNGDLGYISSVDEAGSELTVQYPPRTAATSNSNSSMDFDDDWVDDDDDSPAAESRRAAKEIRRRRLVHPDRPAFGSKPTTHGVRYHVSEVRDELQLAWATTVHKAQGGEFPVALLLLHETAIHELLLQRPLLYTAVSRARALLVVVGTRSAISRSVSNLGAARWQHQDTGSGRAVNLVDRLRVAAARCGVEPFPRLVFTEQGWQEA